MSKLKEYIQRILTANILVENHLYYFFLFIAIFCVHVAHFLLIHPLINLSSLFFIFVAFSQSFLEVLILVTIGKIVQIAASKRLYSAYIFLTFFLLVAHCLDVIILRLWDVTFLGMINSLAGESIESLMELLHGSNVHPIFWALGAVIVPALLVLIGRPLLQWVERKSTQKPLLLSYKKIGALFCLAPTFLVVSHLSLGPGVDFSVYYNLERHLPWKNGFVKKHEKTIEFSSLIHSKSLDNDPSMIPIAVLQEKPDIFLFIVESLREDFLTEATSPHLTAFKRESGFSFEKALSSGNGTQPSWYSLFFSEPALFWEGIFHKIQGSPALVHMKQLGYAIHVLTSSRLGFYNMDTTLFGKDQHLTDSFTFFGTDKVSTRYEADKALIGGLCDQVQDGKGGRLFIIFLDSTHFGYSLPKDEILPFSPYPESISYLGALYSKEALNGIKNRYKNAIYSVDKLFGKFMHTLKSSKGWESSIVVFTADHGEEFYEHGHLFHASNLDREQTRIPLVMKLGNSKTHLSPNLKKICSHEDVFATLFHHLQKEGGQENFRNGLSLLSDKEHHYVSVARFNFNNPPTVFLMQGENFKAVLAKEEKSSIFHCKKFKILSVTDSEDNPLDWAPSKIDEELQRAYEALFLQ